MCTLEQIAKKYDKSIAQVSLNWLVTNPKVAIFTIPGIRSEKQAESNLGALGWSLSAEDREIIDEAAL